MKTTPSPSPSGNWPMPGRPPVTTADSGNAGKRALVIGGGGAAGNAWSLGLIAGLADAGVDVTSADLIIGTSSGSTVTVQITSGTTPSEFYAAILAEPAPTGGAGAARGRAGRGFYDWSNGIIAAASDATDMRRRMGAAAIEMDTSDGADSARWRAIVSARLPNAQWPQQKILITSVDARTGDPVVFDRDSGVALVDAVAASSGNGYRIGERRFINGGNRRSENADLAAGYGVVLVLSPFGGRSRTPRDWGLDLATQVAELRAGGSTVETIFPDDRAGDVFNADALDPSTRLPAARGGFEQGRDLAPRIAEIWT
jgi:NTE family protein